MNDDHASIHAKVSEQAHEVAKSNISNESIHRLMAHYLSLSRTAERHDMHVDSKRYMDRCVVYTQAYWLRKLAQLENMK